MEKYNGWTNYATWRVNLEIFDGMEFDHYPTDDELQELAYEIVLGDISTKSLAHDYTMQFMFDVNWSEIASHAYYVETKEA